MKSQWIQTLLARRYVLAALAGLALAAAFPKISMAGMAWVAPGLILFSAAGKKPWETFRVGYVAGFAYGLGAFYWLLFIPFPAGAITGWIALSAYLAAYFGFWVWLCWRIYPARAVLEASDSFSVNASESEAPDALRVLQEPVRTSSHFTEVLSKSFLNAPLPHRVLWALSCAVIWVALEMVLARLFTGFPWNLLGVSQYQILPLIQIAPLTGVYGVSFLLVWFAVSLANATYQLLLDPTKRQGWLGDLILPLVALLVIIAFGSSKLAQQQKPERTARAVLIQPSIPQTLIWDTNQNNVRFSQLLELSERALRQTTNAQLLVWPEASVPNMLRYERPVYDAITNLTAQFGVWMILGSDDAIPREGSAEREFDFFNSSFLVSPSGAIARAYQKRRLVIFGEYIPLERWLPFMKYLTPVGGSFASGQKATPFYIPELELITSVLICFEDIFPHYSREYVRSDTDFLLNLTNNGWFGESAAQWQHAANAVFRAVEGRIPLVRCANNGLTCWVDSNGAMHDILTDNSNHVYGAGFQVVDIPLLAAGTKRQLTFYTRHGDWFGWACVAGTAGILVWLVANKRRPLEPLVEVSRGAA